MILVTGGTGLVGSHLLFQLAKSGNKVRALKRENSSTELVNKIFGYYSDVPDSLLSSIEWVNGDISDIYSLYDAMDGVDKVYHAAAIVSFNPADRQKMIRTNINGTANVVNAALHKKVKKLCHVSSIAAIGRSENDDIIDEETPWKNSNNNSFYSISKYGAEREVWRGIIEGLNSVIINPSVIIGHGDWNKGSSSLFNQIWKGLKFYTEGVNGYVDVKDVVKAMILLMESEIVNSRFVISSENVDYLNLFKMMADGLGKKHPFIKANPIISNFVWRVLKIISLITRTKPLITKETARTSFQKYYYSNKKIKKAVNFEFISVSDSIKETCACFLKDKKN